MCGAHLASPVRSASRIGEESTGQRTAIGLANAEDRRAAGSFVPFTMEHECFTDGAYAPESEFSRLLFRKETQESSAFLASKFGSHRKEPLSFLK